MHPFDMYAFFARRAGRAVGTFVLLALFAGCASGPVNVSQPPSVGPAIAADASVDNVYALKTLPPIVRRVVVLPPAYNRYQEEVHDYLDELWSQAIQRQNRFEVIALDRATMAAWSGRPQWTSTEPLPARLRERIAQVYAPDAILLCDITHLESYQPLEIGLRAKLYDWHSGVFLWGVDGVWTRQPNGMVRADPPWLVDLFRIQRENNVDLASISPRYFYYHLVESIALTLPERPKQ